MRLARFASFKAVTCMSLELNHTSMTSTNKGSSTVSLMLDCAGEQFTYIKALDCLEFGTWSDLLETATSAEVVGAGFCVSAQGILEQLRELVVPATKSTLLRCAWHRMPSAIRLMGIRRNWIAGLAKNMAKPCSHHNSEPQPSFCCQAVLWNRHLAPWPRRFWFRATFTLTCARIHVFDHSGQPGKSKPVNSEFPCCM